MNVRNAETEETGQLHSIMRAHRTIQVGLGQQGRLPGGSNI